VSPSGCLCPAAFVAQGKHLAWGSALPEVGRVKNLRTLVCIAAGCGLAILYPARADASWQTDYKKAQEEAKASNKLLVMEFTGSDWCPPCMQLQRDVFSKPEFQDYATKNLVLLELDFPRRKSQAPDLAKQNEELAARYGIEAFPSVIILNADGKKVGEFIGFDPNTTVGSYIAQLEKLRKS
jgi:thioredoxin-related protein